MRHHILNIGTQLARPSPNARAVIVHDDRIASIEQRLADV
jgi:hypothetical protein